ncbi:MAG: hypothetical protein ACI4ES_06430 [Roseburia sp.]
MHVNVLEVSRENFPKSTANIATGGGERKDCTYYIYSGVCFS